MSRAPKVMAPVLVVRLTPVAEEPCTEVLPKFKEAPEVSTLMPMPVEFVMVVDPVVKLPATPVRLSPVVVLLVDEMAPNVAASVPLVRSRAWPTPFRVTSEIVSVPKPLPLMSVIELPPVKPVSVLPEATVIEVPALEILTMVAFALLVAGKGSLFGGGVRPVIADRLAVASCPMSR